LPPWKIIQIGDSAYPGFNSYLIYLIYTINIYQGEKMKTKLLVVFALVVALLSACAPSAGPTPAGTLPPIQPATGSTTAEVKISGFAFDPTPLTVTVGTTVTWTNEDSAPHTIVSDTGLWTSPRLGQGETFSFTFDTAGTYAYHCGIHASMTGTITVEP
jgi:plastocyanin